MALDGALLEPILVTRAAARKHASHWSAPSAALDSRRITRGSRGRKFLVLEREAPELFTAVPLRPSQRALRWSFRRRKLARGCGDIT